MATTLKNAFSLAGLAVGVPVVTAHGLNIDSVGVVPHVVALEEAGFTVAVDATNVTVTRGLSAPAAVDVMVWFFHSITAAFPPPGALPAAFPIIIQGGGAGGGSGNAQRFRYSATGAEGSDFVVPLPAARANDNYIVHVGQADADAILGMHFPDTLAGDRTAAAFRVVTTAAVVAGDVFEFVVTDPTS